MVFNWFKQNKKTEMGNMRVNQINENYMVCAQINVADVADAKAFGFDTIMCNRPDNEETGQPSAGQIERAAKKAGLKFFFVPMAHSGLAADTLDKFRSAVSAENGKILAYCRTGNRCTLLWKMAHN